MTDFYIFRHGNTEDTERFSLHGSPPSMPILPNGIPALNKIGKYLKQIPTDINFTSPYLRCLDSSNIVGLVSGKKYLPDDRIHEYLSSKERFSNLRKRVKEFLDEIESRNYSAISICSHGAVIAAIKHLKRHGHFFFFQILDFPKPGNLIIIKRGKVEVLDFNK